MPKKKKHSKKSASHPAPSTFLSNARAMLERHSKVASTPAAIAVAVKQAEKKIEEQVEKAVEKTMAPVIKAAVKAPKQAQEAAEAAAAAVRKCSGEMTKMKAELEHCKTAISLGNIGRGLRMGGLEPGERERLRRARMKFGHERRALGKAHEKAMEAQRAEARKATEMLAKRLEEQKRHAASAVKGKLEAPKPRPKPRKKTGPKPPPGTRWITPADQKMVDAEMRRLRKKAGPKRTHPASMPIAAGVRGVRIRPEAETTAAEIIQGALKKSKINVKVRGRIKQWEHWQCAGPVRTGCGHSGSFVVGDQVRRPGIRLHGAQPYPTS